MSKPSELIDADAYLDLYEASEELAVIRDGELMLHQLQHPRRGLLTALQIGDSWFVTQGDFIDRREDCPAEVVAFQGSTSAACRPVLRPTAEIIDFAR